MRFIKKPAFLEREAGLKGGYQVFFKHTLRRIFTISNNSHLQSGVYDSES